MHLTKDLVDLIQSNAEELTNNWLDQVNNHPATGKYRYFDRNKLYARAYRVYRNLGDWISHQKTKQRISDEFIELGAERYREGFQSYEVTMALVLIRRVLWAKVIRDGFLDSAMDLNMALILNQEVSVFFDRAIYYALQGFEQARQAHEDVAADVEYKNVTSKQEVS